MLGLSGSTLFGPTLSAQNYFDFDNRLALDFTVRCPGAMPALAIESDALAKDVIVGF